MNNFRINNINNMNNVDEFISNQGFMSERTKSPRRVIPNIAPNQYFEANEQYPNVNRINSNRDMSPNKIIAKNKPLLANNVVNNRRIPPVQNNFHGSYQAPFVQNQNRYGYDMKAPQQTNNLKNIKSPRTNQQSQFFSNQNQNVPKKCQNHQNKKAEYMAETDGQFIYYCETCAAKLAANNFEVIKLPVSGPNHNYNQPQKTKPTYQRREIPCIPEYKGNPVYESIVQFLKEIFSVEQQHYQNYEQLEKVDQHYDHQIEMVDEFYRQLLDILSKMREDHLADIEKEQEKHSQIKAIYLNEIKENLSTMDEIVNDLEVSFDTVVTDIKKEYLQHFNDALEKNRSKIRIFNDQCEQQKEIFNNVIFYKEDKLSEMIGEFQNCLTTLWQETQEIKPEKNGYQKNIPPQNKQIINPQLRQPNIMNHQQNNINFNAPSSSNNILQPKNRQNSRQNDQKLSILQMHQNSQKPGLTRDFQKQGAFRQIFPDDEDENQLEQQVSPNFKKI